MPHISHHCVLSHSVWLFATPWTVAHQVLLSLGFSSKNTGVGCYVLLQGIFPTQGLNPHLLCLLHWQKDSLPLNHLAMLIPNSVLLLTQHTSRPLLCSINWCILKNANSFQHQPEQNKRRAHQPWDNKSADELVGVFLLLFFKKKSATDMYNTQSVKSTCWKSMGPIFSLIN